MSVRRPGRLVAAFLLLFTACVTVAPSRQYRPEAGSGRGLVVLSLTQPWKTIKWMYRDLKSTKGIKGLNENFISTKGLPGHQLIRYDGNTILYPIELEAGEYEFFRWTTPEFGTYAETVSDYSVKFRVVAGQVTYIGNLQLRLLPEDKFVLIIRDMYDRDVTELTKAYQHISRDQVITDLMRHGSPNH